MSERKNVTLTLEVHQLRGIITALVNRDFHFEEDYDDGQRPCHVQQARSLIHKVTGPGSKKLQEKLWDCYRKALQSQICNYNHAVPDECPLFALDDSSDDPYEWEIVLASAHGEFQPIL
jgi:hypothetical protein